MAKTDDSLLSRIPEDDLRFTFVRSGGPGGQNVNKLNTKAVLKWNIRNDRSLSAYVRGRFMELFANRINAEGCLVMSSQTHRDAPGNKQECLDKLSAMLAESAKVKKRRRATRPTRGSVERRLKGKKQQSEKKKQRRTTSFD